MPAMSGSQNKSCRARSEDQLITNGWLQRWKSAFLAVVLLFGVAPLEAREPAQSFDIVITNGRIIDRTCSPWDSRDIRIPKGQISVISNHNTASPPRTTVTHRMS